MTKRYSLGVFSTNSMLRTLLASVSFLAISTATGSAAGLTTHAPVLTPDWWPLPITNSMIMVWMVVIGLVLVCQAATKKMTLIPTGLQNGVEWLVESLYNFLEGILGEHLVKRTFWFFATMRI